MYTLYILKSKETGKFYIGQTDNITRRLKQHKAAKTAFGKRNGNIELAYTKGLNSLREARKLEGFIKRQKSHKFIEKLISGVITIPR